MSVFVPFVSDGEVVAIGRGFCTRTLPKAKWTHAAHFATTLWLLRCHPEIDVSRALPEMIRTYNVAMGGSVNTDTNGYHETITQASLRAAVAFLRERAHLPLFAVCNELMESQLGSPEWVLRYWSRERLYSVEARRKWVEPDLEELPW